MRCHGSLALPLLLQHLCYSSLPLDPLLWMPCCDALTFDLLLWPPHCEIMGMSVVCSWQVSRRRVWKLPWQLRSAYKPWSSALLPIRSLVLLTRQLLETHLPWQRQVLRKNQSSKQAVNRLINQSTNQPVVSSVN